MIKDKLAQDIKDAMRAREQQKLEVLRLISSEFKKIEVDKRIELDDAQCIDIMSKMLAQRNDSIGQFTAAGRLDLAQKEELERDIILAYMPAQLSQPEIEQVVADTAKELGVSSVKDMGKLMASLKAKLAGRADMAVVGAVAKKYCN